VRDREVGAVGWAGPVDPDGASSSGGSAEPERVEFADEDPARRAAADVERLMSEATGLRRIVDLAGEVREGGRPDLTSGSGEAR
jgi:hypothetical protein